jgi:hypothetical protein
MKKSILSTLMATSVLFSGMAFADSDTTAVTVNDTDWSKGWYVGAGINKTANNNYQENSNYNYTDIENYGQYSLSADTQKLGFGVLVGKHVNQTFAVEASYNAYGTNSFTGTSSSNYQGTYNAGNQDDNFYGLWSTSLLGVLSSPVVSGFSAHVKGGAAYFSENWKNTFTPTVSNVYSYVDTGSYSGASFSYGFGFQFDYKQFGLSFDWTRIDLNVSTTNYESGAYVPDQYSVTLLYNFD